MVVDFHLRAEFGHWSLGYCKGFCTYSHVLFYGSLSLHIGFPVFLPFWLLYWVEKRWRLDPFGLQQGAFFFICNWRQHISFFLSGKKLTYLDLSPHKRCLLNFIGDPPPRSSLHYPFNQIRVVARTYVKFDLALVLFYRLNYHVVWESHLPQKISEVVCVKRRFKFGRSPHNGSINHGTIIAFYIRCSFSDIRRMIWLNFLFIFEP